MITLLVSSLTFVVMAHLDLGTTSYSCARTLIEGCMAWMLLCAEAIVVEKCALLSLEQSNLLHSVVWGSNSALGFVGSITGGLALIGSSYCVGFDLTAASLAATAIIVFATFGEAKRSVPPPTQTLGSAMHTLWEVVRNPIHMKLAVFIMLYGAVPDMDPQPLFFYYTNQMKMSTVEMAEYSGWQQGSGLIGTLVYGAFFSQYSLRSVVVSAVLVSALLQCTHILLLTETNHHFGISSTALIALNAAVCTIFQTVLTIPLYSASSLLCPRGLEAVAFAFFTSMGNFGNSESHPLRMYTF